MSIDMLRIEKLKIDLMSMELELKLIKAAVELGIYHKDTAKGELYNLKKKFESYKVK